MVRAAAIPMIVEADLRQAIHGMGRGQSDHIISEDIWRQQQA